MSPSDRLRTVPSPPWTSAPENRASRIRQVLERWHDLTDTGARGFGGDGDAVSKLPHDPGCLIHKTAPARCTCSYRTVQELERLIRQLRDTRHGPVVKWTARNEHDHQESFTASPRALWWHLNGYYIQIEHRSTVPPTRTPKNKRKQLARQPVDEHGVPLRQVRVSRVTGARLPQALKAVQWLSENWGLGSEPMLPRELVQAA